MNLADNPVLFQAALDGLQLQLDAIRDAMRLLHAMLDERQTIVTTPTAVESEPRQRRQHQMSDEGRRRISEAQLRRWRNYKNPVQ